MEDFVAQAMPYATAVFVVLGVVALVFLIIVLYRVSVTLKSVQIIAADAEKESKPALAKINPMVDKAELMLDTVNLEMLRVDAILEDVEQITDVAGKAATTVDTVTSAPAEAVTSLVDRIRGTLGTKRSNKAKQEHLVFPVGAPAQDADDAPKAQADPQDAPETSSEDDELKKEAQRLADINVDISFESSKLNGDEAHEQEVAAETEAKPEEA